MKCLLSLINTMIFLLMSQLSQSIQLFDLQGFGADMSIRIDTQLTVKSLAEFTAFSKCNNCRITFAPSLVLTLSNNIVIANQSNIILHGPVTLQNFGIYIQNSSNIILRDIRILNASIYGILIFHSQQVVVDHCTILDASRTDITSGKCIDLTEQSSNVTISNSILGYTFPIQELNKFKGLLIANFKQGPVSNVSLHHNLFYCNYQRSPQISTHGLFDMRENVIFNYTQYGSRVRNGAFGNFVSNWYIGGKKDPLVLEDMDGAFAVRNTWLTAKVQKPIDDHITHEEYSAPSITTLTKKETVQLAGCLLKSKWQTSILTEVSKYLQ